MPFFHYQTSIYQVPANITGGTETEVTIDGIVYKVHTFTSNGTLVVTPTILVDSPTIAAEYLAVGGGGNGGVNEGGGGGGGQVLTGSINLVYRTYTITVGTGRPYGSATTAGRSRIAIGSSGIVNANAGGAGGASGNNGDAGASGGGGGSTNTATTGGTPLFGGNNGGGSTFVPSGGGGGGWNGAGQAAYFVAPSSNYAGNGGDGILINFNGTPTYYGPGGGGGRGATSMVGYGLGGLGGGGNGATRLVEATEPTPNRGAGGGGGSDSDLGYGATPGGTGIVMIRYPLTIV